MSRFSYSIAMCFAALILVASCQSPARVAAAPEKSLLAHRTAAVVDVRVNVLGKSTTGGDMAESVLHGLDTIFTLGRPTMKKEKNRKRALLENRLREHVITIINQNMLRKGFAPIERLRVRRILKEQKLSHSGLLRDTAKLGRLLKADSIFMGSIIIRRESGMSIPYALACLFPPLFWVRGGRAEILFSGRLTSVESGEVLISGTSRVVSEEMSGRDLDEVIQAYFADMPAIRR